MVDYLLLDLVNHILFFLKMKGITDSMAEVHSPVCNRNSSFCRFPKIFSYFDTNGHDSR